MKSLTLISPTFDSVKLFDILHYTDFTDAEYYSQKNDTTHLLALYRKENDEAFFRLLTF